jgi:hypothetical protein
MAGEPAGAYYAMARALEVRLKTLATGLRLAIRPDREDSTIMREIATIHDIGP